MVEIRRRALLFIVIAAVDCSGMTDDDPTEVVDGAITAGATYYLKLPKMVGDTGNCLDVYGLATADKAPIDEWDCNGSAAQKFVSVDVGGGYYQLKNTNSGKCLNVYSGGLDATHASTGNQDGSLIQQYTCNTGDNNYWKLVPYNGYYQIVSKLHTGDGKYRCIDIRGGDTYTANGTAVELWTCGAAGSTKGNQTVQPVLVGSGGSSTTTSTGPIGSGWTEVFPQLSYDQPPGQTRHTLINGEHHFWLFNTDESTFPGRDAGPRSEMHIHNDYTSGQAQFQADIKIMRGCAHASIMQIFGAENRATAFMAWAMDDSLAYYGDQVITSPVYDQYLRLNVIHNTATTLIDVYVNGQKKATFADHGPANHYFKTGIYHQPNMTPRCDVYLKNLHVYKK